MARITGNHPARILESVPSKSMKAILGWVEGGLRSHFQRLGKGEEGFTRVPVKAFWRRPY